VGLRVGAGGSGGRLIEGSSSDGSTGGGRL
jgi:hypothetical protein